MKNDCPDCYGLKDVCAKRCHPCRMKSTDHPRLGQGKDWHLHSGTGYMTKCINGKWTYQHRHVMEQVLGRKLEKNEHVHHKNHDKTDNRIENLEILDPSTHHRNHMLEIWADRKASRAKEMSALGHQARWGHASSV